MTNDILQTTIKHHIYELCLKVLFDNIKKNFPRKKNRIPTIGERYVVIHDKENGDTYYTCTIIDPKKLDMYADMDDAEKKEVLIAIKYAKDMYDGDVIETNGEQYFSREEVEYLIFTQ